MSPYALRTELPGATGSLAPPQVSKTKAIIHVLLVCLAFVALVTILNGIAKHLFSGAIASGIRGRVNVELTAAMVAESATLCGVLVYMKRRGQSLRSFGLWKPAPFAGWLGAAVTAALFIAFNLALPLHGSSDLGEISFFHLFHAVSAGLVAGFVEETLFRGFIMEELRSAGFGNAVQVLASSLLYGAVHIAWGLTSGVFTMELTGGAVIGTAVFGLFCSAVYLLSRRSLMPIMLCHGLIDFTIEPWLFMVALKMLHP